jgi:hypothetical protein
MMALLLVLIVLLLVVPWGDRARRVLDTALVVVLTLWLAFDGGWASLVRLVP